MTDSNIIKSFECCYLHDIELCAECPNKDTCGEIDIIESVIDLINRLMAENERLRETLQVTLNNSLAREELFKHIKAEARQEFAKRLKAKANGYDLCGDGIIYQFIDADDIDDLTKEMESEDK